MMWLSNAEEAFQQFVTGIPSFKEMSENMQGCMRDFYLAGYLAALTQTSQKENTSEQSESRKVVG